MAIPRTRGGTPMIGAYDRSRLRYPCPRCGAPIGHRCRDARSVASSTPGTLIRYIGRPHRERRPQLERP